MRTTKVGGPKDGGQLPKPDMTRSIYNPFADGTSYLSSMLGSKPVKGVCLLGKITFDIFIGSWFEKKKSHDYRICPDNLEPAEWDGIVGKVGQYTPHEKAKAFALQLQQKIADQKVSARELLVFYGAAPAGFADCLEFCLEAIKNRPYGQQGTCTFPKPAHDLITENPRHGLVQRALALYVQAMAVHEPELVDDMEATGVAVHTPNLSWWQVVVNWWYGE